MSGRRALAAWIAALLTVVVAAGGLALWLSASGRAQRTGSAPLAGLAAAVEVRFDARGVPAIAAGSATDAMAALGWLHANDRLFQMELSRRAATGRLSEILGERALAFDLRVRRLGFTAALQRLVATASDETRRLLDAYAAGVNSWLEHRRGDLPPEFRLLGFRPRPWRPQDSVGVIFVMARTLSPVVRPPEEELFRLLGAFGSERARELAVDPRAEVFDEVAELARSLAGAGQPLEARAEGAGLGSNSWAVGSARSRSGHALLANDPHLSLGLPNVWYQARIVAPDYDAAGMTLPGAPAVVLGRGPRLAWACTNLYVDDVDLFVEQVDASGTRVRRGDEWRPIASTTETFRLAGREVEVEVRRTDRGAFLGAEPESGLPARSIAWTGWEVGDQLAAFVGLARADSIAEVPAVVSGYVFPAQNLTVADADGRILWTPLGRSPRRRGWNGRFPAPGWRPDVGWDGLVPAAENPVLIDPATAAIATANSTLPVDPPAWFEDDLDTPHRLDRIVERLASSSDWSVERFVELQLDTVSLWARRVVAALGDRAGGYDGDAERAAAVLRGWDGAMAERGPSALFVLLERELQRRIFEDEAASAGLARFGNRDRLAALLEGRISDSWFDDVSTPGREDRAEVMRAALAASWRQATERWGEEPAGWAYGRVHRLTLDHPLGALPLIGGWWRRGPFEVPGSATTILAFGGPWRGSVLDVAYGPSMRFVTDAGDPGNSWAILPGGQSGHPADRHYDDRIPVYLAGGSERIAWSGEAILGTAVSGLRLLPAPASGNRRDGQ